MGDDIGTMKKGSMFGEVGAVPKCRSDVTMRQARQIEVNALGLFKYSMASALASVCSVRETRETCLERLERASEPQVHTTEKCRVIVLSHQAMRQASTERQRAERAERAERVACMSEALATPAAKHEAAETRRNRTESLRAREQTDRASPWPLSIW